MIYGEKSPAIVAIAINMLIATTPVLVWILLTQNSLDQRDITQFKAFLSVALVFIIMMIYASIVQLMLLMKSKKRPFYAIATVGAIVFLPPIILSLLGISPEKNSVIWLFSSFPWAGIQHGQMTTIFLSLLAEFSVLALLNFHLTKQVKLIGESATKSLLAGR